MTAFGYPDWQPNVVLADTPVLLLNATDTANSTAHDLGDVRRYASYVISAIYSSTAAASATNYAKLTVRFFTASGASPELWEDLIELNPSGLHTFIVDGMHGAFLNVQADMPGVAGQQLLLRVVGSNRPVDRLRVMERSANARILVAQQIVALAAGATTTIFAPVVYGPADIRVESETQPCDVTIFAGSVTQYLHAYSLAANSQRLDELILPTRPLRIDIHNSGAAAGTYEVTVWARDN